MKNKYVEFAKKYFANHPEYQQNLDQMAFQMKIIGIPEKDIEKIIVHLAKQTAQTYSPHSGGLMFNKTFVFLLLTYMLVISGMFYFIFFFKFPAPAQDSKAPSIVQNQEAPIPTQVSSAPARGIIKKVYANELPIQMQKVFSYPVQNDIPKPPSIRPKREVVGFVPYWTLDSLDKLQVDQLTSVNLFGIEPDGDGNIIITGKNGQMDGGWNMWNDPRLTEFISNLKKKQIRVNITIKSFSNQRMNTFLSSEQAQKKLISNIIYMVNSKNLDGVDLDFEYVGNPPNNSREGFTEFVNTLSAELKREFPSSTLTIDTYASSGVGNDLFDLPALSFVTDGFIIMAYDFHTPRTGPGPVSPLTGEKSIASYLANYLTRVPANKIILGVPYYGYDWLVTNPSPNSTNILSYADIAAASSLSNIQWDSSTQTPWYQYSDGQGGARRVHFENVRSLGLKYDLVNERSLKGIGIWAVGYEGLHNELNQLISQKFGY
ncbi:MAG: Glycosyl hydrolase, family 18 [Candidatus Levybacteria bacterium GW2011_GWA2_40_8]|nr:MAG: Glycosyl hydrolase, family 18 [Candidatus Levybacteria bacterium GW2011_GWA2_40_8]